MNCLAYLIPLYWMVLLVWSKYHSSFQIVEQHIYVVEQWIGYTHLYIPPSLQWPINLHKSVRIFNLSSFPTLLQALLIVEANRYIHTIRHTQCIPLQWHSIIVQYSYNKTCSIHIITHTSLPRLSSVHIITHAQYISLQ